MSKNLSIYDQIVRLVAGMAIFTAVLLLPHAPAWVALLGTYPVFTAILGWDPFHAFFLAFRRKSSKHNVASEKSSDAFA